MQLKRKLTKGKDFQENRRVQNHKNYKNNSNDLIDPSNYPKADIHNDI